MEKSSDKYVNLDLELGGAINTRAKEKFANPESDFDSDQDSFEEDKNGGSSQGDKFYNADSTPAGSEKVNALKKERFANPESDYDSDTESFGDKKIERSSKENRANSSGDEESFFREVVPIRVSSSGSRSSSMPHPLDNVPEESSRRNKMLGVEASPENSEECELFNDDSDRLNPVIFNFKIKNETCSSTCDENCSQFVETLDESDLYLLKNKFKCKSKLESKKKLLLHLKTQLEFGLKGNCFIFKNHKFCLKAFSTETSVSEYLLKVVLKDIRNGVMQYVHGNDASPRESAACVQFIAWVKCFIELWGQNSPDERVTVLPSFLTKAELFKLYIQETNPPHLKKSTFYSLFRSKFGNKRIDKSLPWVRISKYSTHSRCEQCVAIDKFQRTCKTSAELDYCRAIKYSHKKRYGLANRVITEIFQRCISYPGDHLGIRIDGMDNMKSYLPRFLEKSKKNAGFFKLSSKITGAIITSAWYPLRNRKVFFYVNYDQECISYEL